MMPIAKKGNDAWANRSKSTAETPWASYSDMMAGLLLIFALTTVITLLDIGERLVKPTEGVREWEQVVNEIWHDKDLASISNIEIDKQTGALVISEKNLRFGFSETDLGREAKDALLQAVPKYFEIIHRYPEFIKRIERIEISGHTDKVDKNNANPYFSRERAGQVLTFLLNAPEMRPYVDLLKSKAVTAAYAATRFPDSCKADRCAAARRVEITIHLDETDMLRKFLKILKQVIR